MPFLFCILLLCPFRIGARGQLQEWAEDYVETDPRHRHISHLYGFHPGDQITWAQTPGLARAVRRTLEIRGDAATGFPDASGPSFRMVRGICQRPSCTR